MATPAGRHTTHLKTKIEVVGVSAMRFSKIAMLLALPAVVAGAAAGSSCIAAEGGKDVKGLYLLTDYPAVSVRPGTTSTIALRLQNYASAPERFALSMDVIPVAAWTARRRGRGLREPAPSWCPLYQGSSRVATVGVLIG